MMNFLVENAIPILWILITIALCGLSGYGVFVWKVLQDDEDNDVIKTLTHSNAKLREWIYEYKHIVRDLARVEQAYETDDTA